MSEAQDMLDVAPQMMSTDISIDYTKMRKDQSKGKTVAPPGQFTNSLVTTLKREISEAQDVAPPIRSMGVFESGHTRTNSEQSSIGNQKLWQQQVNQQIVRANTLSEGSSNKDQKWVSPPMRSATRDF